MDTSDLSELLEQLEDKIDELEEVLSPILGYSLSKVSSNLPLMDKAKFFITVSYSIESLIFSYLRLHGVDALQHPVFRELTRVKQYFGKIKTLETEPEERTMTLDKAAATRFIKHDLAGNDKIDLERAEQEAKERARAQFKATMLAKKNAASSTQSQENITKRGGVGEVSAQFSESSEEISGERQAVEGESKKSKGSKSSKKQKAAKADREDLNEPRRQKKVKVQKAQDSA